MARLEKWRLLAARSPSAGTLVLHHVPVRAPRPRQAQNDRELSRPGRGLTAFIG